MFKHFTLTTILIANLTLSFAQRNIDFNNYRPLEASGEMPEDFFEYSFEKVERDLSDFEVEGLKRKKRKNFVKGIHYGIDQMLHSGKVLYGDPVSEYVEKVGKRLVMHKPELANLRFYTLRSNVVNALSTHQGIIFVTQGLMAQIENEAQLAFILAHEIAHYMENHVVQSYVDHVDISKSRSNNEDKIKKLSQYSREKEFEADEIGIEIYHNAGYSKDALYDMFDLLAYSYLPFEIKKIPDDYWNSDLIYIPQYLLKNTFPEMSTDKEYDDSKSSHPNIASRSEKLDEKINSFTRWSDRTYFFDEDEFKTIRTLCRFESIRNNLYNFSYAEALYSVFLLEEDYPDNLYLNRCKAQSWAGLIAGKADRRYTNHLAKPSIVQGPAHKMNYFLWKLTKQQLYTVGIRMITDINRKFKSDKEINAVYDYAVSILANERLFDMNNYFNKTYPIQNREVNDTLQDYNISLTPESNKSAVDAKENEKISDKDFHLYALSDLVNDSYFLGKLEKFRNDNQKSSSVKSSQVMTYTERKENTMNQQNLKLGLENLILLEPQIVKVNLAKKSKPIKTEKLQVRLHEIVEDFESMDGIDLHKISRAKFKKHGTIMFNEKSALINAIIQIAEYPNSRVFPVDYSINQDIINRYNTTKVAHILIESQFNKPITFNRILAYFVAWPIMFIDIPIQLTKMFEGNFNVIVFDMENYNLDAFTRLNYLGISNKPTLHAMLYDLLHHIKQPNINSN